MVDKELPMAFGRLGSKRRLVPRIRKLIPTKEIKTFVEPFVGNGSVMLGTSFEPGTKLVINDKDSQLITGWKALKTASPAGIEKYNLPGAGGNSPTDLSKMSAIANSKPTTALGRLVKYMVRSRGTFGGNDPTRSEKMKVYRAINPYLTLKKLPDYKAKLKNTTILNKDALSVISQYDGPNTFFYLDPPYEKSAKDKIYTATKKDGEFNNEKLAERLRKIKGKFLLSMNDSSAVRRIFKGFKIRGFTLAPQQRKAGAPGSTARKEVFISNY